MRVPLMIVFGMTRRRDLFSGHRDHTAVSCLADDMFQLDGGVVDAKALAQRFVDVAKNRVALGCGHIGDFHVRGKRVVL